MFDAIAARYDLLNHLLSAGLDRRWRRRAIAELGLRGHETVLDLCTGTADLALEATGGLTHARRVVGIDFSSEMLRLGRAKVVERPLDACRELVRVLRPNGTLVILEFSLPRTVVLRSFYLWYFRHVLPLIGRAISNHRNAYTYLPASVEAFPSPEEFSRQLRRSGFGTVRAIPLTFGVVYLFVAVKDATAGPSAIID